MKLDIVKKVENNALQRTELRFVVDDSALTPKRSDLRSKIAALLGAKEDNVVVDRIEHRFGSRSVSGTARVYRDSGKLKAVEQLYLVGRNIGQKKRPGKKKKAEAGAKAQAKPGEEKKEAAKGEAEEGKKEEKPEQKEKREEAGREGSGEERGKEGAKGEGKKEEAGKKEQGKEEAAKKE